MAGSVTLTSRERFTHFMRLVALAASSGALAGVLVFGVGGRLAMRLLAITSDDSVQGAFSDDAEVIGQFTLGGTIGFIIFVGLFFGLIGGLLYGALRALLPRPRWQRVLASGGVVAAIGTPILIKPDGRDFTILEPGWLAVALFVVLPFAFGALVAVLADRMRPFYETASLRSVRLLAFAPMLLLVLGFPLLVGALLGGLLYAAAGERSMPPLLLRGAQAVIVVGALALAATGVGKIADIDHRAPRPSDFVEPVFD